jgi:hypothetical protein
MFALSLVDTLRLAFGQVVYHHKSHSRAGHHSLLNMPDRIAKVGDVWTSCVAGELRL